MGVTLFSMNHEPAQLPYLFFNVISGAPPLLGFPPTLRRVGEGSVPKDTVRNIRETGEFVVNIVTLEDIEAMNLSSGDYDSSVNEFEVAKLNTRASKMVRPPQVAESPLRFECKLHQILDFGTEAPSASLVIGEIVSVHIEDRAMKDGRLDPRALDLVGRMGGSQYSRTTTRFTLERPRVERP